MTQEARMNMGQKIRNTRRQNILVIIPPEPEPNDDSGIASVPAYNEQKADNDGDEDDDYDTVYGLTPFTDWYDCMAQTNGNTNLCRRIGHLPIEADPFQSYYGASGTQPTSYVGSSPLPLPTASSITQESQSLATSTPSPVVSKYPEQNSPSTTLGTTTPTPDTENPPPGGNFSTGQLAAAIMLPMLFILVLAGLAVFFYRRRSQRSRASGGSRAMKVNQDVNYAPMTYTTPQEPPPMATRPSHLHPHPLEVTNIPPIPYPRPQSTQPIILGPMSQSNSSNYHTGLDSDVMSISESAIQRNGGFPVEDPDEPPPPYRPRSVMTFVSREISTRSVSSQFDGQVTSSTDHLVREAVPSARSPFADPDPDDDAVSIISEPERTLGRSHDIMSDVSDLSYQNSVRRP